MPRANQALVAFNRGIVSPLALARTDLEKIQLAAEKQVNWMPRLLGSMMLRPGLGYIGTVPGACRFLPFIYATDDTAAIELTDSLMRVWVDDALVTRETVSTTITNGTFTSSLSGWTDASGSESSASWTSSGAELIGNSSTSGIIYQAVSVASAYQGVYHGIHIVIGRGPVTLKIGSSQGAKDYMSATLYEGVHSLNIKPTGTFYIQFESSATYPVFITSVAIESGGTFSIVTPWSADEIADIQFAQSADVLFVGCPGLQQRRIERRADGSWSVVKYYADDGPFNTINTTSTTITPSAIKGTITLTSSTDVFESGHVGANFRLVSQGQVVSATITGDAQYTDYIKVTGVDDSREFTITITIPNSDFTGTLTLQRSISDPGAWTDVKTYTEDGASGSWTYNDDEDNVTIYYRIGVVSGNFPSGSGDATIGLSYSGGSITGIVRVTAVASSTSATAIVLTNLGGTTETENWYEGAWSDATNGSRPSAVAIYEGRLWWAGNDRIWGSYSDAYASYDDGNNSVELEAGDSSEIDYNIGAGPVNTINWLAPLLRLIAGTQGNEASIQSSSYDEVLTPDNFHIKYPSSRGSSNAGIVVLDERGIFVHHSGRRVYELNYNSGNYDYTTNDMTAYWPECGDSKITRVAAQRLPDDRIHCVRADGTVAVLIRDPNEDLMCWVEVETNGTVVDAFTLPGDYETAVYYVVLRNGTYCLERWALESECVGGSLNKQADSFVYSSGTSITSLSGLDHLNGETVVCWADGSYIGDFTVSDGSISLGGTYTNVVAGLSYTAQYKSSKLAYAAGMGTALSQRKRVDHLALIMRNTHYQGVKYGPDFDNLDNLPLSENYKYEADTTLWDEYDKDSFEFDGSWDTDSRMCLEAVAPKPCTILAAVISLVTHDK